MKEKEETLPMKEHSDPDDTSSKEFHPISLFQSVMGTLQHICTHARPDIATALNSLAKYQAKPLISHYRFARKCVNYLLNTKDWTMHYHPSSSRELKIVAYSDSNYKRVGDCKSTYGFAIYLNENLLKYRVKKISRITKSTCVAELLGLFECVREIKGIILILKECGLEVKDVLCYCDNK